MHIDQIATRFDNRPNPQPGDVPITHHYRQRWWLPIIGPTATCLLTHLAEAGTVDTWTLTPAAELAHALGLGNASTTNSPLIRAFRRIVLFGLGHFDIEPGDHGSDPCITIYRTVPLVPEHHTRRWPHTMRQTHAGDLAAIYRQVG